MMNNKNNSSSTENDDHFTGCVLSSTLLLSSSASTSSSSSSTTTTHDKQLSKVSMNMSTCTTKTTRPTTSSSSTSTSASASASASSTSSSTNSNNYSKLIGLRLLEIIVVVCIVFYQLISLLDYIGNEYIKQYIDIQQWDNNKRSKYSMYYGRTCRSIDTTTTVRDDLYLQPPHQQIIGNSNSNSTTTTSSTSTSDNDDKDNNTNFINHMNIHGAMIIPNLLSETTASALRDYIISENSNSGKSISLSKMNHRWAFSLKLHSHRSIQLAIQELLSNTVLMKGIEQLIGHVDPSMIELSAITAEYGAETQLIHSDSSPLASGAVYQRNFIPSYSIFIPLQNTTTSMGATVIAPGTHMCGGTPSTTLPAFPLSELSYSNTDISTITNNTTPSIWQVGTGVIMNSQLQHYGPAYTDPNGIKRVILIPTFTNRPLVSKAKSNQLSKRPSNNNNNKLVVESRTISHGTVYGIHWTYLGHTVSDWLSECYYYLNNTTTTTSSTFSLYVRTILRSLRSLGIMNNNHPTYTSWTFWQQTFNRLAIHDVHITPNKIVNEYIPNNILLHYFLFGLKQQQHQQQQQSSITSKQNAVNENDDDNENDNDDDNDRNTDITTTTTSSRRTVVTIPDLDDYDVTERGSIVSQFLFDLLRRIRTIVSILVSCMITIYLLYLVHIRRSYTISTTNSRSSSSSSSSNPINTIQTQSKSSLMRITYFYFLIVIGFYTYRKHYIDQSVWGNNIKSGRVVNIPEYVAQYPSTFTTTGAIIDQRRLATLPTAVDILVTYHVQSHYLGAYRTIIDMKHPGNIYWYNTIVPYYASMYQTVSDSSSSSSLQHTICTFIIQQDLYMNDYNDNDQRRILTKNNDGQWTVTTHDEALQFCHISLLTARTTVVQKEIIQEINFLWAETQYGYFRSTALHRIHIPEYLSLLKNKLSKYIPYEQYQLSLLKKQIRHTQDVCPIRLSSTPLLSYQSSVEQIQQRWNAVHFQLVIPKSITSSSSKPNLSGIELVRSPSTISSILQQLLDSSSISDDRTRNKNKKELVQSHYANEPFPGAWIAENDMFEVFFPDDDVENFWYIGRIESVNIYRNTVNIVFPDSARYIAVERYLIRRPIEYKIDEEIQISLRSNTYQYNYQYTDGRILRIVDDGDNNNNTNDNDEEEEAEEMYQDSGFDNIKIQRVEVAIYETGTIEIVSSTRMRRYPTTIEEEIE